MYKRQPEIAVATTKAYSAQLTALYMLAMKFARVRGTIDQEKFAGMLTEDVYKRQLQRNEIFTGMHGFPVSGTGKCTGI